MQKEDYLKTLYYYLKYNGSVQKVAESNNAHRNTINYRMSKIKDILDYDFSDGEENSRLLSCFYLQEILEIHKKIEFF